MSTAISNHLSLPPVPWTAAGSPSSAAVPHNVLSANTFQGSKVTSSTKCECTVTQLLNQLTGAVDTAHSWLTQNELGGKVDSFTGGLLSTAAETIGKGLGWIQNHWSNISSLLNTGMNFLKNLI